MSQQQQKTTMLLITSDQALTDRVRSAIDNSYALHIVSDINSLPEAEDDRVVVLIDQKECNNDYAQTIRKLRSSFPAITSLVFTDPECDCNEVVALKSGVRGFLERKSDENLIKKAIEATHQRNEVWIQRQIVPKLISELEQSNKTIISDETAAMLESLSPREHEVARLVCEGDNNKEIARKLDISERTVKAHLSTIFKKLEIDNRLNLAIFFKDLNT